MLAVFISNLWEFILKSKALDELKDGALVAIPNDPTNGGRALILMAKAGIITLKDNNDIKATVQDVVANPKIFNSKKLKQLSFHVF